MTMLNANLQYLSPVYGFYKGGVRLLKLIPNSLIFLFYVAGLSGCGYLAPDKASLLESGFEPAHDISRIKNINTVDRINENIDYLLGAQKTYCEDSNESLAK